ncbi:amino acid ABC transporter permease [Peptoniphilus stercorisuis]|uniref:Lysine transport system permease protein n=1 Tax=Peptoniphilus stercorisuis TaxID=1436965 RepID=A0ABS4KEE9_9FIRM|nr:amino acid ABC transporter permease [Peptoniphilus stercorisuis]MBP2025770.1 putative lysine transport system permease protein [Peptoniphilus stercorisuis]
MDKIYQIFMKNSSMFVNGTIVTLKISIIATIIGLIIGLFVGSIRTIPEQKGFKRVIQKIVNAILVIYIQVFRGTPMMVQAILVYYGSALYYGVQIDNMSAAYFIVSVNTGAYMAEVVRGGISSIDKGQFEAAYASGMTHAQTMLYVIIPQTIKNILPATGNEFVINIKDTSVLNVIAVSELFFASKSIAGQSFDMFNTFLVTAIIYLVLTTVITQILQLFERKLEGSSNYELKSDKA